MGLTTVTSIASHRRISWARDWLNARGPAEEVIVGSALGAANELARSVARGKRASFGYYRVTLGQLASALAQPTLSTQQLVPLSTLGVQAVTQRTIHKLSMAGGLGARLQMSSAN